MDLPVGFGTVLDQGLHRYMVPAYWILSFAARKEARNIKVRQQRWFGAGGFVFTTWVCMLSLSCVVRCDVACAVTVFELVPGLKILSSNFMRCTELRHRAPVADGPAGRVSELGSVG